RPRAVLRASVRGRARLARRASRSGRAGRLGRGRRARRGRLPIGGAEEAGAVARRGLTANIRSVRTDTASLTLPPARSRVGGERVRAVARRHRRPRGGLARARPGSPRRTDGCAAIKAFGARRVEETDVWRKGGHRSAAHWVAEATGETVGAAGRA